MFYRPNLACSIEIHMFLCGSSLRVRSTFEDCVIRHCSRALHLHVQSSVQVFQIFKDQRKLQLARALEDRHNLQLFAPLLEDIPPEVALHYLGLDTSTY